MSDRTGMLGGRDRRHLGLIRATVADNRDAAKRGRLKVIIPEVSGASAAYPEWAEPAIGFGKGSGRAWCSLLAIPRIGDVVWVQMVLSEPESLQHFPVWFPGWAIEGAVPELLQTHYPDRHGLVTPSGHSLYFDDTAGADGDVQLAQRDGAQLKLAGGGDVALDSKSGGKVKFQGGGRRASGEGHTVDCGTLKVTAVANGAITIQYTPPGGVAAPYTLNTPIPLSGKISEGEDGVEIPG